MFKVHYDNSNVYCPLQTNLLFVVAFEHVLLIPKNSTNVFIYFLEERNDSQ